MFGNYIHALVVYAPIQCEIVPLSSVNTENQERLFSQARKSALATSSTHSENIISTLTLRLQATTDLKTISSLVKVSESKVSKLNKSIPQYLGTPKEKHDLRTGTTLLMSYCAKLL